MLDVFLLVGILIEQFVGVVADLLANVWVFDIQVVVAGLDVVDADFEEVDGEKKD